MTESIQQAIIGNMLLYNDYHVELLELKDGIFSFPYNSIIKIMQDMMKAGEKIDVLSVNRKTNRKYEKLLNTCIDYMSNHYLINVSEYISQLNEISVRNTLNRLSGTIHMLTKDNQDNDVVVRAIEECLVNVMHSKDVAFKTMKDIGTELTNKLKQKAVNSNNLFTGYSEFDQLIGGIEPYEVVVLAARPKIGKTAFALNMAYNFAKKGKVGLIFNYEMSPLTLVERLLCKISEVPFSNIRGSNLTPDQTARIAKSFEELVTLPIYFDDTFPVVEDLVSKVVKFIYTNQKLDYVIIDYLQLINTANSKKAYNRNAEIGNITRQLVVLAYKYKIPIILLCQLNRDVEKREGHRPVLSDLRDSGNIEQDAHKVMFLYKESDEHQQIEDIVLDLQANRNGDTGRSMLHFKRDTLEFI